MFKLIIKKGVYVVFESLEDFKREIDFILKANQVNLISLKEDDLTHFNVKHYTFLVNNEYILRNGEKLKLLGLNTYKIAEFTQIQVKKAKK